MERPRFLSSSQVSSWIGSDIAVRSKPAASAIMHDTFNRTTALGAVGVPDNVGAQTPLYHNGLWQCNGSKLVPQQTSENFISWNIGITSYTIDTTIGVDMAPLDGFVACRFQDKNNIYGIWWYSGHTQWVRRSGGNYSTGIIQSNTGWTDGIVCRTVVSPTKIIVYRGVSGSFTPVGEVTNSDFGFAGAFGFRSNNSSAFAIDEVRVFE